MRQCFQENLLAPDVYCLHNFSGSISNALENNPDITFTSARNGLWTETWKKSDYTEFYSAF